MKPHRLLCLAVVACCACIPPRASVAAEDGIPRGRLPQTVVPERYALALSIDPSEDGFQGEVRIALRITSPAATIWMHARELEITAAAATPAGGRQVELESKLEGEGGLLRLEAKEPLPAGEAELRLRYRAKFDRQLNGLYKVVVDGESYAFTHMEPLGARRAFPCFDEPAFKTPWEVEITARASDRAVANAHALAEEVLSDGRKRFRFAPTEPLPTYLVAFAVGPFDIVDWAAVPPTPQRATPLPLRGVTAKGRGAEVRYALASTASIIAALEGYVGLAYPFDKLDLVAAPDFAAGAMENAGLIVYRDGLLLVGEKSPTRLRQSFYVTHVHELSHMWFGDLVTMPWWDDIWLNESFATWMATKIADRLKPEYHAARRKIDFTLWAMQQDSLASTRRIHEPVNDFTEVLSAFDDISYAKGGAVLAMFESYLGEERFRDAIRTHLRKFARRTATSADFMDSLAAASDGPATLKAAFRTFTEQPGLPLVGSALSCEKGEPSLAVSQRRYLPLGSTATDAEIWSIPLCVRYGAGAETAKNCVLLEQRTGTIQLPSKTCPDWVLPNADGAGYYRFELVPKDEEALRGAFDKLSDREQHVYADSLAAAFDSGALSAEGFLAALPRLAIGKTPEVVASPFETLEWMHEHLAASQTQREALEALLRRVYRPVLDGLGLDDRPDDSDDARLLRQRLVSFLARTARDAALRKELAARARRVLGDPAESRIDPGAMSADERGTALWVLVQDGDAADFNAIERRLRASEDSVIRRELLDSLGAATRPDPAARARELALDPALRSAEAAHLLEAHFGWPENRRAAREWLRVHIDPVVAKIPETWQAYLAEVYASGACSEEEARDLSTYFGARMAAIEGGPRTLEQTRERTRLCAALRAQQSKSGFGKALDAGP